MALKIEITSDVVAALVDILLNNPIETGPPTHGFLLVVCPNIGDMTNSEQDVQVLSNLPPDIVVKILQKASVATDNFKSHEFHNTGKGY